MTIVEPMSLKKRPRKHTRYHASSGLSHDDARNPLAFSALLKQVTSAADRGSGWSRNGNEYTNTAGETHMVSRRALTWLLVAGLLPGVAFADGDSVPLPLQARLCAKVVKYDKNFARRARERVLVLIVHDAGSADSRHAAATLKRELEEIGDIGGVRIAAELYELRDPAKLRSKVDVDRSAIVYLTPGLGERASAVSRALSGADVLSVSAVANDVKEGIVLGFDLVSSQPKLWVNLSAAQRQNVVFEPQALKLMRVFR